MTKINLTPRQQAIKEVERILRNLRSPDKEVTSYITIKDEHIITISKIESNYFETRITIEEHTP